MAALVEGRPIPFSFKASLSSSSSTDFPAVSMARNNVASVYGLGGWVHFSAKEGVWGPVSPLVKAGKVLSNSSLFSSFPNTVLHPGDKICFPVALNSI